MEKFSRIVPERKPGNFVEYKADENSHPRHILNIPRIRIFAQRRDRQKSRFLVGHKMCCWVGLIASLLFVSACNEEQAPAPDSRNPVQVVSKSISKPKQPKQPATREPLPADSGEKQDPVSGDSVKEQVPVCDPLPDYDLVSASQSEEQSVEGATIAQKAGISTPMEKYDRKNRVDPFIPLIAEKNASAGSGSPVDPRPKRQLTPLEKLELSQIKLVAVVEMSDRTIAMVEDAGGKGYEIGVGTYIGPNGGKVKSITRNSIKIEKTVKDYKGNFLKQDEEIKFHKSEDGE